VITGAAQGIGRTLALELAAEGAKVAVLARDRDRAQLVVDEIGRLPGTAPAMAVEADVGDEAAVIEAAAEVDRAMGRVDALINNAGWMPGSQPILEVEVSVLERVFRSNVIGSFLTTKHFAPLMIRSGGGRIIYLTGAAAIQSNHGGAPYGGSKAAINILANVAHQELADDGIRTVAIAPGLTVTPGMRDIVSDDYIESVASRYPGGRVGRPEDLVALTAFLCSDAANHLSGTVIMGAPRSTAQGRVFTRPARCPHRPGGEAKLTRRPGPPRARLGHRGSADRIAGACPGRVPQAGRRRRSRRARWPPEPAGRSRRLAGGDVCGRRPGCVRWRRYSIAPIMYIMSSRLSVAGRPASAGCPVSSKLAPVPLNLAEYGSACH
jgi:NAD(P)-dependent dehydrogenase (short-subunit alcohol dehydrogenase family)